MDKICIFCKRFAFETGEQGWSEVTPGSDAWVGCRDDVWTLDDYVDTTETYRAKLLSAETCKSFDPVDCWKG